jgi:hypothetical protein
MTLTEQSYKRPSLNFENDLLNHDDAIITDSWVVVQRDDLHEIVQKAQEAFLGDSEQVDSHLLLLCNRSHLFRKLPLRLGLP